MVRALRKENAHPKSRGRDRDEPRRGRPAVVRQGVSRLPRQIPPMLAALSELPGDPQHYGFEYKWDGVRAIVYASKGELRIESRNLLDITGTYPEMKALGKGLGQRSVVLDGEIVALGDHGRPDFPKLQNRMHVRNPSSALMARVPVAYMVFDVLFLDGRSLMDLPYVERRRILEKLHVAQPGLVPPMTKGDERGAGQLMLQTARDLGLEGVVAKRLESAYEPGRRSGAWKKIKVVHTTELVIGGWVPERSGHERIGALLLGFFDPQVDGGSSLLFAGRVGSGFNAAEHERLVGMLKKMGVEKSPFSGPVPAGGSPRYGPRLPQAAPRWVRPRLVAAVEYRRWPNADAGGVLQQAAYKGLRNDKAAREVVRATVLG